MKGFFLKIFLLIAVCLSAVQLLDAQIKTYDKKGYVSAYSTKDTVYVYRYNEPISFYATRPKTDSATFEWYKLDTTSSPNQFKLYQTDYLKDSSVISSQYPGCFKLRVKAKAAATADSFVVWAFLNPKFNIQIEQDASGYIPYFRSTCDYADLNIKGTYTASFSYSNPVSGTRYTFKNELTCKWTESPSNDYQFPTTAKVRYYGPPAEETTFSVVVTDRAGYTQTASVMYKPIVPKAEFTWKADSSCIVEIDGNKNSAPFKVTFTNKSKNGIKYTYFTGDGDTLEMTGVKDTTHTYYIPRQYHVTLLVESQEGCTDSIGTNGTSGDKADVVVDAGQIKGETNVFTPGYSKNNIFKFQHVSVKRYHLRVFSRWGKQVYEASGENMQEWNGWDGTINNGGEAADGVYFYVLEATPYDTQPDAKKIKSSYSGYFYLFRKH